MSGHDGHMVAQLQTFAVATSLEYRSIVHMAEQTLRDLRAPASSSPLPRYCPPPSAPPPPPGNFTICNCADGHSLFSFPSRPSHTTLALPAMLLSLLSPFAEFLLVCQMRCPSSTISVVLPDPERNLQSSCLSLHQTLRSGKGSDLFSLLFHGSSLAPCLTCSRCLANMEGREEIVKQEEFPSRRSQQCPCQSSRSVTTTLSTFSNITDILKR